MNGLMIARRLLQLYAGLMLYGFSVALMVRADLGLNPWNVFHQGVALRTGLSFGTAVILVGAVVLLLWWPLRQKPGIGTVSNIFVIGLTANASLQLLASPHGYAARFLVLGLGILLNGIAGGAYIGAGLGPGPRDGLMTGLSARTGRPLGPVRTGLEIGVLAIGWLLGGTAGIGTLCYALAIGWLVELFLPWFTIRPRPAAAPDPELAL